ALGLLALAAFGCAEPLASVGEPLRIRGGEVEAEIGESGVALVVGGFRFTLHEPTAHAPRLIGNAAVLDREGGRSTWTAGDFGVEEWLEVDARRDRPVGRWTIEGARL